MLETKFSVGVFFVGVMSASVLWLFCCYIVECVRCFQLSVYGGYGVYVRLRLNQAARRSQTLK
jgi:hypothetical protein